MSSKHVALLDMATALNVWVDVDDVGWLSPRAKGGWVPQHDLILLAPGLHPVEELCTLAHELGHATLGHTANASGWFAQRQERAADRWAARTLISPVEYELAERLYEHSPNRIAQELDVTPHIVTTWQQHHRGHTGCRTL